MLPLPSVLTLSAEVAPKVISLSLFNPHSLALPSVVVSAVLAFFTLKVCLRASSAVTFPVALSAAVLASVANVFNLVATW